MAIATPPITPQLGPKRQSTAELLQGTQREMIIIAGKDGSGKSCAIVSVAAWVQNALDANAKFYVLDTENKFPTALRSFGPDAPTNIVYFKCETMNHVTDATDVIMAERKPGDWLAVESMSRVWERAQDMGYQAISGFTKAAYLEKRRAQIAELGQRGAAVVIPKPDDFWNIVKGAHDGAFLDLISQATSLNVMLSTTIAKPPKSDSFIKENATRKEARIEFGMDCGIDGAPRLPYFAETFCLLESKGGAINCRVVRDNVSAKENTRPEFEVADRKAWATAFWVNCR